ncbi:MAG: sister chromatid cohesion protein PDS5, partial [Thermodesulfobacteriota bacterium]
MPGKIFYSIGARGGVLMCAMVLAASILVSCAPWYQAYDIGSDEDLTKLSVVPELRKALRDEDPDVRMQAAMAIKRMGPDAKDAIPDLVDTLDDDDYDVRREAANAIEALLGISDKKEKKDKDKEGGKDLSDEGRDLMVMVYMNRLESKDWMTRRDAANHLAQMGPDAAKAVPALVAAMMDESDWGRLYNEVRRSSARALGEMRYEARAANPALIKASTFHDYDVRLEAVKALGKIGPKSEATVIEALKVALKDSDFDVRREAANALGGFEVYADSTVPNLVKALSDMDFDVRREAAKSLGRIGPKTDAAVEALLKTTNDADADVRQAAVEALANVQPEDRAKVLPVVLLKLDDMDEDVRMTAVRTIAKFRAGDAGTLAALERVGHEDQSFTVKKAALETLYVLKGVETGVRVADTKAKSPVRKVAASSGSRTADRTPAQTIHATVDALNIRELPSVSSRRVGKLHRNET